MSVEGCLAMPKGANSGDPRKSIRFLAAGVISLLAFVTVVHIVVGVQGIPSVLISKAQEVNDTQLPTSCDDFL
jgi:hypothetical protein